MRNVIKIIRTVNLMNRLLLNGEIKKKEVIPLKTKINQENKSVNSSIQTETLQESIEVEQKQPIKTSQEEEFVAALK